MAANVEGKSPNESDAPSSSGPPPYSGNPPGPPPVPGPAIVPQTVGLDPTRLTCRSCNQSMVTRVERKVTARTHIVAVILFFVGCWPCVCCPYCMHQCLDANHYCTNCGAFVGSYTDYMRCSTCCSDN